MTREMFDAVTPANIPANAQMVAGYLPPSRFAWSQASWDRFPNAAKVRIAVRASTNDGHVLDVEAGDATPAQAPGWARMRRASGYATPAIYCSVSVQSQVIDAFNQAGEPLPLWWLAHYDNVDALPAGAVAKQYADPGPYDRSIVADVWPGVDTGVNTMEWTDNLTNPHDATQTERAGDLLWEIDLWCTRNGDAIAAQAAQITALQTEVDALKAAQAGTVDPGPYTLVKENPPAN